MSRPLWAGYPAVSITTATARVAKNTSPISMLITVARHPPLLIFNPTEESRGLKALGLWVGGCAVAAEFLYGEGEAEAAFAVDVVVIVEAEVVGFGEFAGDKEAETVALGVGAEKWLE